MFNLKLKKLRSLYKRSERRIWLLTKQKSRQVISG